MTLRRQQELVVQLRELLDGSWSSSSTMEMVGSVDECSPVVKVESNHLSTAEEVGGGIMLRRRRGSMKRAQQGKDEHGDGVVDEPAGSNPQPSRCSKRRKKQQSRCLVTSVPDFDGYQWRKYGQKQIEGAVYPRSYYRCTRNAEQGCLAKRTVQRNDNNDGGDTPKYTVVYMAEHTCIANDSMEAPVILETAAAAVPTKNGPFLPETDQETPRDAADSSSISTTGTESPATSDVTWGSEHVIDNWYDDRWAQMTTSLLDQDMDDFTGPIRSPVRVTAGGCWTIDQFLLNLVNDPILSHF